MKYLSDLSSVEEHQVAASKKSSRAVVAGDRDASTKRWADRIRLVGLRVTLQRIAVLDALAEAQAPLSHAEIIEQLGNSFDKATIYRNLVDMTEAGLLSRRDLGDHCWRFELRGTEQPGTDKEKEHPHFVCSDCGTVACLETVEVSFKGKGKNVPKAIGRRSVEVQVKGKCDDCYTNGA